MMTFFSFLFLRELEWTTYELLKVKFCLFREEMKKYIKWVESEVSKGFQ